MKMDLKNVWDQRTKEGSEFFNLQNHWNNEDSGIIPANRLFLQGAMTLPVRKVTAATTLSDLDYVLLVNSSGSVTVTLPDASVILGRTYIVMEVGTGTVQIVTTNSQTMNGGTTLTIPGQYFQYTFFSDGANWIVL